MRAYSTIATFGQGNRCRAHRARRRARRREPARCSATRGRSSCHSRSRWAACSTANPLRGYEEFSITPHGYLPNADQFQAQRSSFGNAYLYEYGRARPSGEPAVISRQRSTTPATCGSGRATLIRHDCSAVPDSVRRSSLRWVRSASISDMGSTGRTCFGHKDPKWQVHFKFGQIF